MYLYELLDVLFYVKCLKFPDPSFAVEKFIPFSSPTRSGSAAKLAHKHSSNSSSHHFYFCRLVRIWNSLPPIDLTLSFSTTKQVIKRHFWTIFISPFDPSSLCIIHVVCPCSNCSRFPINVHLTNISRVSIELIDFLSEQNFFFVS